MLGISVIQKLYSPGASAVVLVQKKEGSLRFYFNLRELNNWNVKDAYSLSQINVTLNSLQGSQWFSLLNLKYGYWQVKIDEESKLLTAFTVGPLGFYKCKRMTCGLTNVLATFQQLMETCLRDLNLTLPSSPRSSASLDSLDTISNLSPSSFRQPSLCMSWPLVRIPIRRYPLIGSTGARKHSMNLNTFAQ